MKRPNAKNIRSLETMADLIKHMRLEPSPKTAEALDWLDVAVKALNQAVRLLDS